MKSVLTPLANIFHFSEAATGGALLEKMLLEILQNSQEVAKSLFQ